MVREPLDPAHIFEKLHPQVPDRVRYVLTPKQRIAIRERDDNKCQGCGLFKPCSKKHPETDTDNLNVHHILPQGYAKKFGIDPDYPENLITVCTNFHTGHPTESIHPDTYQARMTYQGQNKDSFKEMKVFRGEMLERREPYWNTRYDRPMTAIAVKNTQHALKNGWEFPYRPEQVYSLPKEEEKKPMELPQRQAYTRIND